MTQSVKVTIRLYIITMLTIFPLWNDLGYRNLNEAKTSFVWIFASLFVFLCIILGGATAGHYVKQQYQIPRNKFLFTLTILFLLSLTLSAMISSKPIETLLSEQGLLMHIGYILIFAIFSLFGSWSWSYCSYITIAVAANAFIATLQVGGKNPLMLYPNNLTYFDSGIAYTGEYLTTMGNTNVLSVWLILATVLCVGSMFCAETKIQRLVGAAGCFAAAYTGALADTWSFALSLPISFLIIGFFIVNSSRTLLFWLSAVALSTGGFILGYAVHTAVTDGANSVLFALALVLLLIGTLTKLFTEKKLKDAPVRKNGFVKRWVIGWGTLIIGAAVITLVIIYCLPEENLNGLLYELHEILRGRGENSFGSHRFQIWKETLEAIKKRPLLGAGAPFSDGVKITFRRLTENRVLFISTVGNAHSLLLAWLYHNGIIGTAIGFAIVLTVIWRAFRVGEVQNRLCCAAVVSYLVVSLFCVAGCFTDPLFWMLMGFAAFVEMPTDSTAVF